MSDGVSSVSVGRTEVVEAQPSAVGGPSSAAYSVPRSAVGRQRSISMDLCWSQFQSWKLPGDKVFLSRQALINLIQGGGNGEPVEL